MQDRPNLCKAAAKPGQASGILARGPDASIASGR